MNRRQGFLLVLVVAFAYLSLLLVLPFAQYILFAVLIAFVLYPLQRRLELRTSSTIAAFSLVLITVVLFIVPFIIVLAVIADDVVELVEGLDPEALQLTEVEAILEEELGVEIDLAEQAVEGVQGAGTMVAEQAFGWIGAITHILIGLGLALFLIYYLLKDGDSMVGWLRDVTPLPGEVQDELYDELDEITRAVLLGHVLIAFIEGAIAGLGLFVTGIPNAAFWTIVMMVLALVPLVGAFLVWGPAVGYLFLTGEPLFAAGLFVYSLIIVGVSDDYLRPIVVDRYAEISPAVIILGVLGGVYAFGVMGLFFGPVILGALIVTLEIVDEYYEDLEDEGTEAA